MVVEILSMISNSWLNEAICYGDFLLSHVHTQKIVCN